jgi:hypothetical protein
MASGDSVPSVSHAIAIGPERKPPRAPCAIRNAAWNGHLRHACVSAECQKHSNKGTAMLPTTEPIFVCQTSVVSSVSCPLMTQQPDQKFVSPRPTYKPAIDMIDAAAQIQASGEPIADRRGHRRGKLFVSTSKAAIVWAVRQRCKSIGRSTH